MALVRIHKQTGLLLIYVIRGEEPENLRDFPQVRLIAMHKRICMCEECLRAKADLTCFHRDKSIKDKLLHWCINPCELLLPA